MDKALERAASNLLATAPASVEMPAGAGKTHLLAAAVAVAHAEGRRSLVLTHTNAGVEAIRKRLIRFGVPTSGARVETITSWAFSLVGAYPGLAGVAVAEVPDWGQSDAYVQGATQVVESQAIVDVHAVSFDFVFVDEYQDCTLTHHGLVLAIANAVPRTVVFGDPLQAIFGFAGPLADWSTDVLPRFPAVSISASPQRWKGHNEDLGAWLLSIRPLLVDGQVFDFAQHSIGGLTFVQDTSPTGVATVAHGFRDFNETVVLLDKWPNSVAQHASRLGGSYSVMEDINGNFMRQQLGGNTRTGAPGLSSEGDSALALWFANFAKACVVGLAGIDNTVLGRLGRNQSLTGLARDGIQSVVDGLEQLRVNPSYGQVAVAAESVRGVQTLKVYRWEAWNDTLRAIEMTAENGDPAVDNLGRVRERLRRQGRRSHSRVASRTLLVKGLEYDHVVIANLAEIRDPRNLYVALSRARKTVTVIGATARITLQNDRFRSDG